jgi:hypothetical protein
VVTTIAQNPTTDTNMIDTILVNQFELEILVEWVILDALNKIIEPGYCLVIARSRMSSGNTVNEPSMIGGDIVRDSWDFLLTGEERTPLCRAVVPADVYTVGGEDAPRKPENFILFKIKLHLDFRNQ